MKCSILIVTYNAKEYTQVCLQHLFAEPWKDLELILFDNLSNDGVREVVASYAGKDWVKTFLSQENLGFALGNNAAAKMAEGEYLFLLNPDTEISPTEINKLVAYLDANPKVGVVGPKIYDADGLVQESYGFAMTLGSEVIGKIFGSIYIQSLPLVRSVRMRWLDKQEISPVGWIGGAALMIRRDLFERLGGIDPNFFYSAGDMVDLCASVKKMGFEVMFYPGATMKHKGGASTAKNKVAALDRSLAGTLYFFRKHYAYRGYLALKVVYIAISLVKSLIATVLSVVNYRKFWPIAVSHGVAVWRLISGRL